MINLMASDESEEVDVDFSDEVSGLAAAIVLAQQAEGQWAEIDIAGLQSSLDDQAFAITESKEEVW